MYRRIAQDDDYKGDTIIGRKLRKSADLKTIAGLVAEEKQKVTALVTDLTNTRI